MPGPAHILLIEDDTSLAANLCDVLKEDGFNVTVCHPATRVCAAPARTSTMWC